MSVLLTQQDKALAKQLLEFIDGLQQHETPEAVLDALHTITIETCRIHVLGALLRPLRWSDWESVELGKTAFLHPTVPAGWWDEYYQNNKHQPSPTYSMAQLAIAPFSLADVMRMLEPVGFDRWSMELAQKYGMRDFFTCPVGGRWLIVFWSRDVMTTRLTKPLRAMLFMGASFAAIQLQTVIHSSIERVTTQAQLTPRE